jgi:hypothetical protein
LLACFKENRTVTSNNIELKCVHNNGIEIAKQLSSQSSTQTQSATADAEWVIIADAGGAVVPTL